MAYPSLIWMMMNYALMSIMPNQKMVVINTTPLLALTAGLGHLDLLRALYANVYIPCEVCQEVRAGGRYGFAVDVFEQASWLQQRSALQLQYYPISSILLIPARHQSSRRRSIQTYL